MLKYKYGLPFLFFFISQFSIAQQTRKDSIPYPVKADRSAPLTLQNGITYETRYDIENDQYLLYPKSGSIYLGDPFYLTQEEYSQLIVRQGISDYYKENNRKYDQRYRDEQREKELKRKGKEESQKPAKNDDGLLPKIYVKSKWFEKIFGSNTIDLEAQGYASIDVGGFFQKLDNPQLPPQTRSSFAVDIQQRIQMSLLGSVGDNLSLGVNYDTQAGFGFENRLNLAWKPQKKEKGEDNIIQNLEFGNVSLPLSTSLITGAQALFGAKAELKFGNTYITSVFSQQQSEARQISVQGNQALNTFKISASQYDYNQHFFFGQFFRNQYDGALVNYPLVSSAISITRLEVWRIDQGNSSVENKREIIALRDLGGVSPIAQPTNGAIYNTVSSIPGIRTDPDTQIATAGLVDDSAVPYENGEHFVVHKNVRRMEPTEYNFNEQLGYISLVQPLDDNELLGIAYEYTVNGNTTTGKVGEFSDDEEEALIVKLIKSNVQVDVASPMWDLMMKNIYSLQSSQLSRDGFVLNLMYRDAESGSASINYLPGTNIQEQPLLQVTNVDRLNLNGDIQQNGNGTQGDGIFDYVEGITINSENGRIIFTQKEPFGDNLAATLINPADIEKFVYNELYDELPALAQESTLQDRYTLEGRFRGQSGSGISLGAINVPRGSVKVTANGADLIEGIDYTVDYQLGTVNIINETLANSGVPISVGLENQSAFNLQKKRFMGVNVEHKFSEEFTLGGTFVNFNERPLTEKAQYGQEPVNNTMLGINTRVNKKSELLTRLTDRIPFIDTDAPSNINFTAEGAYIIPGLNTNINNESYIDDFDEAQSRISLDQPGAWSLASTPQNTPALFPNGSSTGTLNYNYNRALLSWYNIDPVFYGLGDSTPSGIGPTQVSNHISRRVDFTEIYPGRRLNVNNQQFLNTFDLTIYPQDKGPYNFNPASELPESRWAGITRPINVTNFVNANIEFVEFWVMSPFLDGTGDEGELVIQLGNVSEDILSDNNLLYENGLPNNNNEVAGTQSSIWGKQPESSPILYSFDTEGEERRQQDTGYDGLINSNEGTIGGGVLVRSLDEIVGTDPSGDDFVFYTDSRFGTSSLAGYVPDYYKFFRGTEGNNPAGTLEASSAVPDVEDANFDNNLDNVEKYIEARISVDNTNFAVGTNYIVDERVQDITFQNGSTGTTRWLQFRIPVSDFINPTTGLEDESLLSSVRYIRMLMTGFDSRTTLRFASLDLVRSEWRRYNREIAVDNTDVAQEGDASMSNFNSDVGIVNVEENGLNRDASNLFPYVIPPGIRRQEINGTTGVEALNEQSITLNVTNLNNDAAGIFKKTNLDLRRYKQLRMFLHAHDINNPDPTTPYNSDLRFFIRIGSDLSDNYYEYETGLAFTDKDDTNPNLIWPAENTIDVNTDRFVSAKQQRDQVVLNTNNSVLFTQRFVESISEDPALVKNIVVKGRPSLGSITNIMMGVRNVSNVNQSNIVIWMNELRLSEVDNEGGYAARSSLAFNLGDFSQIQASGNITSLGFGALDQGPSLRGQTESMGYNLNTTTNLDKFLPEKWGIKLPLSFSYGESFETPEFNPLDDDVVLKEDLTRASVEPDVRTYSRQRTLGFSNVRKIKQSPQAKNHFYDVENLAFSFLFSDSFASDLFTEKKLQQNLQASLNYSFNFDKKYISPFKKWRDVKNRSPSSNYLVWLKEFNFNFKPTTLTFRADLNRIYNEQKSRDVNALLLSNPSSTNLLPPTFGSQFSTNWQYNLGFDITKSLTANISSNTSTIVDDVSSDKADDKLIFQDLLSIGRPVSFSQIFQANYKTPIDLMPYLFWVTADVGYTSEYNWQARSSAFRENITGNLGNLAENAQTWTVNGALDFKKLFNTFDSYSELTKKTKKIKGEKDAIEKKLEAYYKKKRRRGSKPPRLSKTKTNLNIRDYLFTALYSFKEFQVNYTQNKGTRLPGLIGEPNFFGASTKGPTTGFLFGSQEDLRSRAIANGWIDASSAFIEPFFTSFGSVLSGSFLIAPTKDLRIDFTFTRNHNTSMQQNGFNIIDTSTNFVGYRDSFENETGLFNMSFLPIMTSFTSGDEIYNTFINNAKEISKRLGGPIDTDGDGFSDGYGKTNSDVLLPAFVSALQGSSASSAVLDFKRDIPLPNWTIQYTGLNNIIFFKKLFSNFDVSHSYSSTYTVSGIQSNLSFFNDPNGLDNNGNRNTKNIYSNINIIESFSPLVGIDASLRNNMRFRFRYNKDRLMSLSLSNFSITEDFVNEFVLGFGYTITDLKFAMRYQQNRVTFKGDLNLRADVSLRNTQTKLRRIIEDDNQVTSGQNIFSLKLNAGYNLSKNFIISAFYDQQMTSYQISTAFPLTTVRAGINATFTIQ